MSPIYINSGKIVHNKDGAVARAVIPFAALSDNEWLFDNDLTDSKGSDDLTNNGLTYGYVTDGGAAISTYGTESIWFTGPANGLMAGIADQQLVLSTRVRITGDSDNNHDRGLVSEGQCSSAVINQGRYILGYRPLLTGLTYKWSIWLREGDGTNSFELVDVVDMEFEKWFDLVFVINPGVSARLWQDGELVYTKALTDSSMGGNHALWVGGLYDSNYNPWNHQGDMQWLRAWRAKNYSESQLATLIEEEHAIPQHDVASIPPVSVKDHEYLFNDDLTDDAGSLDLTNNGVTFTYIEGGGVDITGPQLRTVGFDASASIVNPSCDQQVIVSARMYSRGMTLNRHYAIFSSAYWTGGSPANGQFTIGMGNYADPELWCYIKLWQETERLTRVDMPSYSHNAWWDMLVAVTPGDSLRLYYEGSIIGTPLDISGDAFSLQVYNYNLKILGLHDTLHNPRNWLGKCKWQRVWVGRGLTNSQIDALATSEHAS